MRVRIEREGGRWIIIGVRIACWIIRTSEEFKRVLLERSLFHFKIHKERKKSPDEI